MLTATEAAKKFEDSVEEKIASEIEKACKAFKREAGMTFFGDEAIVFVEEKILPKLKESGYKVEEYTNKSTGILTSTTSTGEPSIQLTIKW